MYLLMFRLYLYVFIYYVGYLLCRHITAVCMHAGSSRVPEYKSTRVDNSLRGQLCTQASVQLHMYTSGTNNHIHTLGTHTDLSTSVITHTKLQRYTSTRANPSTRVHYVRGLGYPCQMLYGYKYDVRAQVRGPSRDLCIAQAVHAKCCTDTSTACEPKHAGSIGASPRLSMP